MSEKINLSAMLNEINQNFAINSASQSKYNWDAMNIAKSQRTTKRRQIRKSVISVYNSDIASVTKESLKQFTDFQESILLSCTKTKKTFKDLQVSDIIPKFETCTKSEKDLYIANHKLIIAKIK